MQFSTLAQYVRRLDETSSRNALVAILAELFGAGAPEEIAPITYLLQGRLAPIFVPLEMGMGLSHVSEAVARAYHADRARVKAQFDQIGDLGTVAGQLASEHTSDTGSGTTGADETPALPVEQPHSLGKSPEVCAVFELLREIAQTAGPGSSERKIDLFTDLLATCNPLSATFLCRIPLGTLRLGVGDPTILDAYSVASTGTTRLRKRLERAYNETSDLGLIGATLWQQGIEAVDALGIRVGNPVRPALAERLPSAEAILAKLGPCAIEQKYDGIRCQVHRDGESVRIFSRNQEDMTAAFPEIAAGALQQLAVQSAILEGEALAYNPLSEEYLPFQQTARRRRKYDIDATAAALPLRLFAFDILFMDGHAVTSQAYEERHALLGQIIQPGDTILISETQPVDNGRGIDDPLRGVNSRRA